MDIGVRVDSPTQNSEARSWRDKFEGGRVQEIKKLRRSNKVPFNVGETHNEKCTSLKVQLSTKVNFNVLGYQP